MERGLLWLPLLVLFFGLAWAGWNEYQKVQGYSAWAKQYEKSKYDVLAALGYRKGELSWGKPIRKGLEDRQVMSIAALKGVQLRIDGTIATLDTLPDSGKIIALELIPTDGNGVIQIPFVGIDLAAEWTNYLKQQISIDHS
ncbi:MAG: hypothetical protein H7237_01830 [Alkalinema sp. FL-bin-369]|nr:hypothetical protein [Leptolyngbyaceae cyanobacterium LF-bin-369]